MLELKNLSAGYPGNPVFENLSLTFPKGSVTVVAGPNGCGKSTLLKAAASILRASGQVFLDGEPLFSLSSRLRARKIAFLPQSRSVPEITVGRLVLHGRFPYLSYPRQYRPADYAAAEAAMETLKISDLSHRSLQSLSGGQRQKAYLAMALAQGTSAILLDEPTTFLDIAHQLQLMELAKDLAQAGKTVVLVLHDLTLAMEHADALVVMDRGDIVCHGAPETVYQSGCLKQVFGIDLGRTQVDGKWKYFYL